MPIRVDMTRRASWGLLTVAILYVYMLISPLVYPRKAYVVEGHSMLPTYRSGQVVWADTNVGKPFPGEVVIAHSPDGDRIIKRVGLVGGQSYEQVYWAHEWIMVAGVPGHEQIDADFARRNHLPERTVQVPEGRVYLLGDNAPLSDDSRDFGPVPLVAVEARVLQ